MKKIIVAFILAYLSCLSTAYGQGVPLKSGSTSDLADINTNKALRVIAGRSVKASYIASVGAQAQTAAVALSLEAPAANTVYITRICVTGSTETASAAVNATVQRTTTASSGGTALTAEGTGTTAISKLDTTDSNYTGVGRLGGTPGTSGAMVDQFGWTGGTLSAPSIPPVCREYGFNGGKPLTVAAGTTNGVIVTISSHGAGALSDGAIAIYFYIE